MMSENKTYTVRKNKKYRNLCGAILAAALFLALGAANASADEVTPSTASTNTTNTTQVSPVNTTEKVEVSKDATFNTEVPTTTKLNEAVSNAKNAGVTVNETSATTVDNNDKTVISKTVVTHTPEKPKPVTPTGEKTPTTPVVYTPEAPKPTTYQAPALPKTGEAETGFAIVYGLSMVLSAVGIAGIKRKQN